MYVFENVWHSGTTTDGYQILQWRSDVTIDIRIVYLKITAHPLYVWHVFSRLSTKVTCLPQKDQI